MLEKIRALKSVSFLWLGSILGSGSTFLIYTIVAREIGPEGFGLFSSAMASATIFTFIAGFGVSRAWLKLFGEEGWDAVRWIKPSIIFVLLTLLFSSSLIFFISNLDVHDETTAQLLRLFVFYVIGFVSIELVCAKFQLEEKFVSLAVWQLLPNLTRLILVIFSFYVFGLANNVLGIGFIYAFVGLVFTLASILKLRFFFKGKFDLKGHVKRSETKEFPKLMGVFSESWPFGLASFFSFIYIQSDIIMLKYIAGDIQAGYYNTSFVILTAILMLPSILFGKFLLPKYHRWANHDKKKFYSVYVQSNKLMVICGLAVLLATYVLSSLIVLHVFGEEYSPSIGLIKVLSFTLPISFLTYSIGATLVTKQHMKIKVLLMGAVALTNILLNILLIPYYGAYGAAIATLSSNALLLILYSYIAKKRVFIN